VFVIQNRKHNSRQRKCGGKGRGGRIEREREELNRKGEGEGGT
jgi:hypothetical protein